VTVERPAGGETDPAKPPFELYVDATDVVSSQIALPVLVRGHAGGANVIRIEPPQVTLSAAGANNGGR
jgi:hypothetical protein